jgi:hypothetical protein
MSDEQRTVVGTLTGIMEKPNDWKELHISIPGKEHPVRMSTKKSELVELARAAGDNVMEWTFTEKDSGKPNPHRPGENFKNRWFESVAPVGTNPAANVSPTTQQQNSDPVDWDAKERRDYRSRAWAQTLGAFTHTIKTDEDPKDVFLRLQPFQRKVYEDVCQSFAYVDDDIPFE